MNSSPKSPLKKEFNLDDDNSSTTNLKDKKSILALNFSAFQHVCNPQFELDIRPYSCTVAQSRFDF